ncbi:MAG: PD-(D/E)XK nuclease family protein [Bacteroidaceae bacterium]|nr:PD-(D/E)XK nuclease family protein [Bacteroidaceae bacterium]
MKTFLELVASDLRRRSGGDLSRTLVVFPGKRAGLFLDEYLAVGDTPMWTPRYATISELFSMLCPLTLADPIETACRIHRLYLETAGGEAASLPDMDRFFGWAERILSDFDDIDKALADARALFVNLGDLREIEARDFLTEAQKETLRAFFAEFDPDRTSYIRERFLRLWRAMPEIYRRLQAELESEGLAYPGMLQRRAVERLEAGIAALPDGTDRVAIVGFNVLSGVERRLFNLLRKQPGTLFYWDYDTYYTSTDSEAGHFMRRNLQEFPNALPEEAFNNLLRPKQVEFVSATSDNAQARYVAPWLRENITADARRTAVVLCDESLLQPVLHALPETVKSINVTKGYPLQATGSYAETMRQAERLEKSATRPEAFIGKLLEFIQQKETDGIAETKTAADILEQEARFSIYKVLTRLSDLVASGKLRVSTPTLRKIIRQALRLQSVAFHGEPVEGLQIMGVLETRCLDFERVLLLSADDNHMPRAEADNSFIPHFLREAYGLTTRRHTAAVYAYYFHRLLSRCNRATAVWCTGGDGISGGEMSRFMTQLLIEAPTLHIHRLTLQARSATATHQPISIPKPDDLGERLSALSPSALNEYMQCPAKFYFSRVSHLKAWEEPTEGLANNVFGTIFHNAAQLLYTELSEGMKRPITAQVIKHFLAHSPEPALLRHLSEAFRITQETEETLQGTLANHPVEREVLLRMLRDLLRTDARLGTITLLGLETERRITVTAEAGGRETRVRIGGFIDRLDRVVGADGTATVRVLDYKTGRPGEGETFKAVDDLFKRGYKRPKYIFQTFLYSLAVAEKERGPIRPALYYTTKGHLPDYNPYVSLGKEGEDDVRPLLPDFRRLLTDLVEEILNPAEPFTAQPDEGGCKFCHFRHICNY